MEHGGPEPSGLAFARLRNARGLSARQLAEQAGVSHSSVSRIERGYSVTRDVLDALAGVLGPAVHDAVRVWPPVPVGESPLLIARRLWGVSRSEAAERIGVSDDVLGRAERGEGVHPKNAKAIADAYGLEVEDVRPVSLDRKARPHRAA